MNLMYYFFALLQVSEKCLHFTGPFTLFLKNKKSYMQHVDLSCDLLHMNRVLVAINYWNQQFSPVAINYFTVSQSPFSDDKIRSKLKCCISR